MVQVADAFQPELMHFQANAPDRSYPVLHVTVAVCPNNVPDDVSTIPFSTTGTPQSIRSKSMQVHNYGLYKLHQKD